MSSDLDLFYDLLDVAIYQKDISMLIRDAIKLCKLEPTNISLICDKLMKNDDYYIVGRDEMVEAIDNLFYDIHFMTSLDDSKIDIFVIKKFLEFFGFNDSIFNLTFIHPKYISLSNNWLLYSIRNFIKSYNEFSTLSYEQLQVILKHENIENFIICEFSDYKNPIVLDAELICQGKSMTCELEENSTYIMFLYINGFRKFVTPIDYQDKLFIWDYDLLNKNADLFLNQGYWKYFCKVTIYKNSYMESLELVKPYLIKDLVNIIKEYIF